MKKILFIFVALIVLTISGCSSQEADDKIENLTDKNNENVLMVKNGHPEIYPDAKYGESFDNFFGSPTWTYFESDDGQDIVEFTGDCTYEDVEVKARLQFILDTEAGTFDAGAFSLNDVPQNQIMTEGLLSKVFENHEEKDNSESLSTEEDEKTDNNRGPSDDETISPYLKLYYSAKEVNISDLLRNPDRNEGDSYIISGIINQVMDSDDGTMTLKVYHEITEEEMILIYERQKGEQRFLVGDYITAIIEFKGINSIEMSDGLMESFPVGETKKIELGDMASAMILVSIGVNELGDNYKIVYEESAYIGQNIDKSCYLFKVYDVDNKCYNEEFLATDGFNMYWYNKDTLEVSESIYQRNYQ